MISGHSGSSLPTILPHKRKDTGPKPGWRHPKSALDGYSFVPKTSHCNAFSVENKIKLFTFFTLRAVKLLLVGPARDCFIKAVAFNYDCKRVFEQQRNNWTLSTV